MLNICILSELYFPERTVPAPILTSIAEGLVSCANVHVICSQPTYAARGIRAPKKEILNGVHVNRVTSSTLQKDVLFYRIINLITISISIFIKSLRNIHHGDIVLVVTNPPLLPFLALAVCKLKRAKFVMLVHDVYPEVLNVAGLIKSNSLVSILGSKLTSNLYRCSDSLVVLGRDMEILAKQKLKQSSVKIKIIPNWAEIDSIYPCDRENNKLLKENRIAEKFVVQYSGNMGRTHGLEDLYQSAYVLSSNADIHFLFIGSGAKKRWLENKIKANDLPNVTILEPSLKENLCDSLNGCDIAIIAFTPGMTGVSVPSRMYNAMAAGKPIIAVTDSDSELALVISEENAGWVIPPSNPQMIVETILYARTHLGECKEKGRNGRRAVEKKYSFKHALVAYEQLIKNIADH